MFLVFAAPLLLLASGAAFTYLYAWCIERRFPPTGRFVEVEGCRLHYREEGPEAARGTVVLLHGAMQAGPSLTDKARFGFRLCLVRPPSEQELSRLMKLYDEMRGELGD